MTKLGSLHHIELRTHDLENAGKSWGWLLQNLGFTPYQQWDQGRSWRSGHLYVVLEQTNFGAGYDRRGAGLNHLAFHAGSAKDVDRLWREAPDFGWRQLYQDRHPTAGGPDQHHGFLENSERFKVELIAEPLT